MRRLPESIEAAGGRVLWVDRPGGVRLRAAVFGADGQGPWLVFLSGYVEFIEKNLESVTELVERGFRVATFDWRGQGLSTRALADPHKGHIDRFETHLDDLWAVLGAVGVPEDPVAIVGHSMGGHLAVRACLDRPGRFSRAVLLAPMIGIGRFGLSLASLSWLVDGLCGLGLGACYVPGGDGYGSANRRFEGNPLTADPERFAFVHTMIDRQPALALGDPTLGWVRAALRSIAWLNAPGRPESLQVPILAVVAGQERIVMNAATERFLPRLPDVRVLRLPEARHDILRETDPQRQAFWAACDAFLPAVAPVAATRAGTE